MTTINHHGPENSLLNCIRYLCVCLLHRNRSTTLLQLVKRNIPVPPVPLDCGCLIRGPIVLMKVSDIPRSRRKVFKPIKTSRVHLIRVQVLWVWPIFTSLFLSTREWYLWLARTHCLKLLLSEAKSLFLLITLQRLVKR